MCCQHKTVTPQKQTLSKPIPDKTPVKQRVIRTTQYTPIAVRQKVIVPSRCSVCGYPIQAVNIAGKTVTKCSNSNCGG